MSDVVTVTKNLVGKPLHLLTLKALGYENFGKYKRGEPDNTHLWGKKSSPTSRVFLQDSDPSPLLSSIMDELSIGVYPVSDASWEAQEYITCNTCTGFSPSEAIFRLCVFLSFGDSVENPLNSKGELKNAT